MSRTLRASLLTFALAVTMVIAMAASATAQPQQEGLVNVNVSDVVVQLPIALAANVCDVNVNALARQFRFGGAECDSSAESGSTIEWPRNGNGNGPKQEGLVNINVSDIVVQAPIGIAANICDVNANILAAQVRAGGAVCTAEALAEADA